MGTKKDKLGDRMKQYEQAQRQFLTRRMPLIIRLDGKAFHSFTKGFQRPFDLIFLKAMHETAKYLCENVQGCKVAYHQSDEITLLLNDWETLQSQSWFDKNLNKILSVSASMATMAFNKAFSEIVNESYNSYTLEPAEGYERKELPNGMTLKEFDKLYDTYFNRIGTAMFDSRAFLLPKEEVTNCLIWRQQDASRNSVQMLGQAHFSHKSLQGKSGSAVQEMLMLEKGINWNDLPTTLKRGACIVKETFKHENTTRTRWVVDEDIPIFTQDRSYIEKFLKTQAERIEEIFWDSEGKIIYTNADSNDFKCKMTLEEFKDAVKGGGIMDDDGFGVMATAT